MSDWMKVLPCRGVDVEVWSQDEEVVLSTPDGKLEVFSDPVVGGWIVAIGELHVACLDSPEQCLWLVIAVYGKGPCDWEALHLKLFGEGVGGCLMRLTRRRAGPWVMMSECPIEDRLHQCEWTNMGAGFCGLAVCEEAIAVRGMCPWARKSGRRARGSARRRGLSS